MIVLLHPFPFDSRVFDGLRAAGLELLTPDLRGTGEPDLGVLADQVVVAMDAAGVERAVIGGVSMGGYVTLELLERHPDRFRGIVLIDTKATADAPPALANRAAMATRAEQSLRPDATELLAGMLSPRTVAARPDLVAALAAVIDDQPLPTIAWNQRAMARRPDRTALVAGTDLPVLVVVGTDDTLTPPGGARQMANGAQQSTVTEIPGTGHLAVAEDPVAVAEVIRSWMGGLA